MACKRACMRFLFLLLMLLLLVTEAVEGKKKRGNGKKGKKGGRRNKGCEDLTPNTPVEAAVGKTVNITCKSLSKIFDLKVTSSQQKSSCRGWQAHMLVRSNTCIGQGFCLDLPLSNSSPIIKSHNESCVGLHPDTVEVSVICTKGLEVVKMDAEVVKAGGIKAQEGIIASPAYPWQYSHEKDKHQVRFEQGAVRTFSYTLYKLDLGEGDTLEVAGLQVNTYNSSLKRDHVPLDGHVIGRDVTMTLKRGGDTPGDGFILCYKWGVKPIADVCKELTESPEKMQECHPSKKRGEKGQKNGRKDRKKNKDKKKKNKKRRREGRSGRKRRRNRKGKTTTTTMIPAV